MGLKLESLFKTARVLFGISLIGVSVWALFLPPVFPSSSHAIVNAKLVTIKAGDPGKISDLQANGATFVQSNGQIAQVTRDLLKIQRDLEQSQFTQMKLKEQMQSLDRLIETREQNLAEAKTSASSARDGAMKAAERNLNAAKEKARIARESLTEKQASEKRVAPLLKDGIITAAQWSETRQQTIEAEKVVTSAELDLASEEAQLAAFHQGEGGQISESSARIDAIEVELGKIRVQRLDLQSELGVVENKIAAAKTHHEADLAYELKTPISGVIWRRHVVNGENLREGQEVVDVADGSSVFVEAFFRQDFMTSIAVGDNATIQLIPEAQVIQGRVVDIQIQDNYTKPPNIISTTPLDTWMLRVAIEADKADLGTEKIGKLAKVLISKPKANLAEKGLLQLTLALRGQR
ncbi:MAG: HlyD family secretion protein [Verrucomicrobiales bacterium]